MHSMANIWKKLTKALDITNEELTDSASPQHINEPIAKWSNNEDMEGMTLLEGVLQMELWQYVTFLDLDNFSDKPDHETILYKVICDDHQDVPPEVLAQLITPQNINHPDEHGCTPLHDAAFSRKFNLIPVLIQHGADINLVQLTEETPLHLFLTGRKVELRDLDDTDRKDLLFQLISDENINMVTIREETPLHLASHVFQ